MPTYAKYASLSVAVVLLATSIYFAVSRRAIPFYACLALSGLFFTIAYFAPWTPIEYTKPGEGFGSNAMNDFLQQRLASVSKRRLTPSSTQVQRPDAEEL